MVMDMCFTAGIVKDVREIGIIVYASSGLCASPLAQNKT